MTTASAPDSRRTDIADAADIAGTSDLADAARPARDADGARTGLGARDALRAALARTAARCRVLVDLTLDTSGTNAALQSTRGRGPVLALARTLFRAAPDVLTTRGLIDFTAGRAAGARPAIAWLEHDARVWHGTPGRPLARLDPTPATPRIAPLTLLALLADAEQVTRLDDAANAPRIPGTDAPSSGDHATGRIRDSDSDSDSERFLVTTPTSADTDAVEAEVTTVEGMLRTVRARCGRDVVTLTLLDVAVDPSAAAAIDWTRLPDPADPTWSGLLADVDAAG